MFFQQKMYPLIFISRSSSLSLSGFSLSRVAGSSPTFSFSLSFSFSSKFLDKLNTLNNADTETICAFRFRLYWLWFSLLHNTRVAMRLPAKITSSCIWVSIPFTLVYLWCRRTVARSGGVRSRDYQLGWMDFLYSCGALRAIGAPLRCLLVVTGNGVLTFLEF